MRIDSPSEPTVALVDRNFVTLIFQSQGGIKASDATTNYSDMHFC